MRNFLHNQGSQVGGATVPAGNSEFQPYAFRPLPSAMLYIMPCAVRLVPCCIKCLRPGLDINKQPKCLKRLSIFYAPLNSSEISTGPRDLNNGQIFDVGFHHLGAVGFQGCDFLI